MIDNEQNTDALLGKLRGGLPMNAHIGVEAHKMIKEKTPELMYSRQCQITDVTYFGDEGGIMCYLDFSIYGQDDAHVVSITHLNFDRRDPLSRDILAYQKHRVKRLKKLQSRGF